jgi:hypothetical protein
MLSEKNSTFSSQLLASEREMFNERSNKLIRNGSVVTSVYFVIQLYLGSGTIKPITHLMALTTLLINAISYLLANKFNYNWIVLFTFLPILMVPIYIDPYVEKGWISYGLIIAVFVITASSIENEVFALTLVIFGVISQYVVARLNLIGVIDNQDILLLNSYFSSAWLLICGISLILIRRSYLKFCDQIDEQLFKIEEELQEEAKSLSQLNLKDHRNIVIHGTVLNTLISYNQVFYRPKSQQNLSTQLTQDIGKIESIDFANRNPITIQELLSKNLSSYGLNLTYEISSNLRIETSFVENLIEIIREIVLNTKKHSDSKNIVIAINQFGDLLQIQISEIFATRITPAAASRKIVGARTSLTLDRLVKATSAQITFDTPATSDRLVYNIEISTHVNRFQVLKNISQFRKQSLTRYVQALCAVSLFYSFLALTGFVLLGVPSYINIAILAISILMAIELNLPRKTQWRPITFQLIALTIIPMTLIGNEECANLLFTPWLFNAIFGSVLFAIFSIKNPILKWLPGIIFVFESLSTRFLYPQQCQTLLDGSTPGFVFIIVFALLLGRARRRNLGLDNRLEQSLKTQTESTVQTSTLVDGKRAELLTELEKFIRKLNAQSFDEKQLKSEIDIWIQKLRAFLICSEHYNSAVIRQIYDFMQQRLQKNRKTRISIYTGELLSSYDFDLDLLNQMDVQSGDSEVELILSESDKLALEYHSNGELLGTLYLTN